MHRKRGWAVAAVLLVVLQLLLQTRAAHIVQQNPTVTVTLSSPLTAGQLAAAREWEKSNANTQAVTASFWSEKAAAVSADSDRTAEDVTCIGFDGTAQDCLPVEYLQGTAPGVVGQQCAISSTLAWTLFGSYDIMGYNKRSIHLQTREPTELMFRQKYRRIIFKTKFCQYIKYPCIRFCH